MGSELKAAASPPHFKVPTPEAGPPADLKIGHYKDKRKPALRKCYVEEVRRAERAALRVRLEMGREERLVRGRDFAEAPWGSVRTWARKGRMVMLWNVTAWRAFAAETKWRLARAGKSFRACWRSSNSASWWA